MNCLILFYLTSNSCFLFVVFSLHISRSLPCLQSSFALPLHALITSQHHTFAYVTVWRPCVNSMWMTKQNQIGSISQATASALFHQVLTGLPPWFTFACSPYRFSNFKWNRIALKSRSNSTVKHKLSWWLIQPCSVFGQVNHWLSTWVWLRHTIHILAVKD